MSTSVQVHGLTEPPEGCEWHVGYPDKGTGEAHKTLSIVARRKWEPKPGEFVDCGFGRRCTFAYDFSSPERTNENKPILLVDEHGSRIFVHPDQIIGPWEPEASEKQEPLAVGDRVKVLPKGDDPLGLWKGTEYRNCGKFGVVSHAYATREFSVRFDGPDNTWAYSRCQLEKLPAEEPAIDVGEGYSRIVWDAENPPVRMEGDEFIGSRGEWLKILSDRVNETYTSCDFRTWPHRRRPITKPWTAPEWARVLGWMTQDEKSGWVRTHSAEPVCSPLGFWGCDREGVEIMALRVAEAKSLNLYPPDWDRLPASERCVKLGGE